MGLDSVELVLATEQAFGIVLPDEEVSEVRTPRQLIALVASKLPESDERTCLSQRAFHLVRQLLTANFAMPRKQVSLDSDLGKLLPEARQHEFWTLLSSQMQVNNLPPLARPTWLSRTIFVLGGAAAAYAYRHSPAQPVLAGLGTLGLCVWLSLVATRSWRTLIPGRLRNMRNLLNHLIAISPQAFKHGQTGWSREQIAETVKQLVMAQFATTHYDEDWDFTKDFGMN